MNKLPEWTDQMRDAVLAIDDAKTIYNSMLRDMPDDLTDQEQADLLWLIETVLHQHKLTERIHSIIAQCFALAAIAGVTPKRLARQRRHTEELGDHWDIP